MFKLTWRFVPHIVKLSAVYLTISSLDRNYILPKSKIQCLSIWDKDNNDNILSNLSNNIIHLEWNGNFIGYAYCFQKNYLICSSPELLNTNKNILKGLKIYKGNQQVNSTFKIIGNFENLSIIHFNDKTIQPLPFTISKGNQLMTPVQIIQKKQFLSIKNGYYVAKEGGFGIVDGKGEIGSLVVSENKPLGIVTHIGRESDEGFIRMIMWKDLDNLVRRFDKQPLYLGISATAMDSREGISVVRVATNSPLSSVLQMGDIITKVNDQKVNSPEDLTRILMLSQPIFKLVLNKGAQTHQIQCHI